MIGFKRIFSMADQIKQDAIEAENGADRIKVIAPHQSEQGEKISVKRRKIGSVTIYDVTETELTILEKGTDASVWLNFFIATVSIGASFLVSLLTAEWGNILSLTQVVFICLTIIMFMAAVVCFVFWIRGRGQHKKTIKTIKERTIQEEC